MKSSVAELYAYWGGEAVRSIDFQFKNINIDDEKRLLDVTEPPSWNA